MMGYIPPQYKPPEPVPIPVGDAAPTDVRAGKSFAGPNGTEVLGTLPERSVGPVTITPGAGAQSKPAGIYGGAINVPGVTVPAASVLAGVTIAGTAGAMPNRSGVHQPAVQTEVWQGDRSFMMPPAGYYDGGSWVYAMTPDLRPENVPAGKSILGVAGTAKVAVDPYNIPLFMVPAGATMDVPLPYDYNYLFIQPSGIPSDWLYITKVNIANKVDQVSYTFGGTPISVSFPTTTTMRFHNAGNGNRWYDVTIIKRLY